MPYERFNDKPKFSLGWVVCGMSEADDAYTCNGMQFIVKNGITYYRPDTYYPDSPYDWEKVDDVNGSKK